jgi:hypothetical protein
MLSRLELLVVFLPCVPALQRVPVVQCSSRPVTPKMQSAVMFESCPAMLRVLQAATFALQAVPVVPGPVAVLLLPAGRQRGLQLVVM